MLYGSYISNFKFLSEFWAKYECFFQFTVNRVEWNFRNDKCNGRKFVLSLISISLTCDWWEPQRTDFKHLQNSMYFFPRMCGILLIIAHIFLLECKNLFYFLELEPTSVYSYSCHFYSLPPNYTNYDFCLAS